MAYKIYIKNNFLYVDDTELVPRALVVGGRDKFRIEEVAVGSETYYISRDGDKITNKAIPLSEILKENDVVYTATELEDFITTNLDFKSSQVGEAYSQSLIEERIANITGHANYTDTVYNSANKLTVSANTDTIVPNNAGTLYDDEKPIDINSFYYQSKATISGLMGTFEKGETITGGTSGNTATVLYVDTGFLFLRAVSGAFTVSETITGGTSGATSTIDAYSSDNVITGRNGDSLDLQVYFYAVPSAENQWMDIWIDITGGAGTPLNLANLYRQTFSFPKGAGNERGVLWALPSGYTRDTWEANGGVIKVRSNASIQLYNITLNTDRTHKAKVV